jgi:hypothetical protein
LVIEHALVLPGHDDEEEDDGEGDRDLVEHEPERVQVRRRAQLGDEDLFIRTALGIIDQG